MMVDVMGNWKRRAAEKELKKSIKNDRHRRIIGECFTQMVAFTKYNHIKKEIIGKTAQSIMRITSLDTRIRMVEAMLGCQMNCKSLIAYCFYKIHQNVLMKK